MEAAFREPAGSGFAGARGRKVSGAGCGGAAASPSPPAGAAPGPRGRGQRRRREGARPCHTSRGPRVAAAERRGGRLRPGPGEGLEPAGPCLPALSPAAGMKVEFAPINVPLKRRIQTVAVLQWIFSFLLLGNSLPPPCPGEKRGKKSAFSLTSINRGHRSVSPVVPPGMRGGEWLPGYPWAGKSITRLDLGLL